MTYSKERIPCPSCRSRGEDSQGNHLRPYDDGRGGWCYKESKTIWYSDWGEGEQAITTNNRYMSKPVDSSIEIAAIKMLPSMAYEPRLISKETMEWFGVKTGVDESTGLPAEHYYPYTEPDGSVVGYKKRTLPKSFSVIGKTRGLFGQNKVVGTNFLILVEGEHDALAARDMMAKLKPERSPYNVVSLPNGANEEGTLDATTRKELEWLGQFNKIVLCLDNDGPGIATANALADYLCSTVKEITITSLPLKDTAAMWEARKEKEWASAINNAKPHKSSQIVTGVECYEEAMTPMPSGIHFSFIPKTCKKLDGMRTGEVTGILAPPNVGKSSLMRQMKYELLINTDDPVGAFFLEERTKKTTQAVLAYHSGLPLNAYRKDPSRANKEKIQEAREMLLPRLHMFEHKMKTLTDDYLERKIEYMVKAVGCKHVFLDHLSFIISGREGNNERKEIDNLLTRLARSVEDWNYGLYIVSHIKRPDNARPNPKTFPYWNTVSLTDGRGSGAIEQLMHKIIAVENQIMNPEDDNGRGMLRTRILRDREWGASGIGDYLTWTSEGKFEPVEIEV